MMVTDTYTVEDLEGRDQKLIKKLKDAEEKILSEDTLEDYIYFDTNFYDKSAVSELIKDMISPFLKYAYDEFEKFIEQTIEDIIDDYSEEEYERVKERRKKREAHGG